MTRSAGALALSSLALAFLSGSPSLANPGVTAKTPAKTSYTPKDLKSSFDVGTVASGYAKLACQYTASLAPDPSVPPGTLTDDQQVAAGKAQAYSDALLGLRSLGAAQDDETADCGQHGALRVIPKFDYATFLGDFATQDSCGNPDNGNAGYHDARDEVAHQIVNQISKMWQPALTKVGANKHLTTEGRFYLRSVVAASKDADYLLGEKFANLCGSDLQIRPVRKPVKLKGGARGTSCKRPFRVDFNTSQYENEGDTRYARIRSAVRSYNRRSEVYQDTWRVELLHGGRICSLVYDDGQLDSWTDRTPFGRTTLTAHIAKQLGADEPKVYVTFYMPQR